MVVDIRGSKKDVEDAIIFCTHRIVDLLDEIEILRNRRRLLLEKQKEMFNYKQKKIIKILEKVENEG